MILTVLKPAAARSMENSVRVNSTATTDCVILNWVVRNKMVCFVRISVCNYLKLCKVLICNHFHFFFFEDTVKSLPQTSHGISVRNTTTKLVVTKFPKDLSFLQVLHSSMLYMAVAFAAFFVLFSSTYFYKHCIQNF